jgi:hypothetical protein
MVESDQLPKPCCASCSSVDILRHAYACWDVDIQQWVLHSCYDAYRCEDCSAESKHVDWLS